MILFPLGQNFGAQKRKCCECCNVWCACSSATPPHELVSKTKFDSQPCAACDFSRRRKQLGFRTYEMHTKRLPWRTQTQQKYCLGAVPTTSALPFCIHLCVSATSKRKHRLAVRVLFTVQCAGRICEVRAKGMYISDLLSLP
jgi:hypothetical protein